MTPQPSKPDPADFEALPATPEGGPFARLDLASSWHSLRRRAAVAGVATALLFGVVWRWPAALIVVGLLLVPIVDAPYRGRRPGTSQLTSMLIDSTITGTCFLLVQVPALAAAVPFTYFATAAGLFLTRMRALLVVAYSAVWMAGLVLLPSVLPSRFMSPPVRTALAGSIVTGLFALMLVTLVVAVAHGLRTFDAVRERRLRYSTALTECSQAFLAARGDAAIETALEALQQATDASAVFIELNVDDPVLGPCSELTHEVVAPDGEPDPEGYWSMVPWAKMPACYARLSQGLPFAFHIAELTGEERAVYEGTDIKSELDIPIMIDGAFAGLLGFSDLHVERLWEADEVHMLEMAAQMVGAFWQRQSAHRQLEELIRSKDEFIASVSHELRTPLTAVVGLAHELRSDWERFGDGEGRELVSIIAEQSSDVANIVQDLLVAARADIGVLTVFPEAVDVTAEIERAISESDPAAGGRVAVDMNGGAKAWADPARLRQILRNLLTNAVRYGGEHVTVRARRQGPLLRLDVVDDGGGLPEEEREAIFDAYHRAHEHRGQPGSVGLGLTVSRKLARLMGGDLVYGYAGGESVFSLTLPADDQVRSEPV